MAFMVGSIVKPFVPVDMDNEDWSGQGHFECETAKDDKGDIHSLTDECIGIVLELCDTDAKVRWVQMCIYHREQNMPYQWREIPTLWTIGQNY